MTTAQDQVTADAVALTIAAAAMQKARVDLNSADVQLKADLSAAEYKKVHKYVAKVSGDLTKPEDAANTAAAVATTWVQDNPVVTPPPPPPVNTVPSAPLNLSATAGNGQGSFVWSAPSSNGGAAITGYRVYLDGAFDQTSTTPKDTLTGLTNGTTYNVAVSAVNSVGEGPKSAAISVTPVAPVTPPPATTSGVMVVMMENQQKSNVLGSSNAPNLTALTAHYPVGQAAFGDHHPSLPNYISIATGIHAATSDDNPPSQHPELSGKPNIFSQLDAANIPWSAWFESLSGDPRTNEGSIDSSGNALYEPHHNPLAYVGTAAQINKCQTYTQGGLVAHLNAAATDEFVFVVPNMDDNMHDPVGSATNDAGAVKTGDAWLQTFLTAVQATAWYKTGGTILIVWDEAYDTSGNQVSGGFNGVDGGPVPLFIISEGLVGAADWTGNITHIGILQSIEKFYGLSLLGAAGYGDISSLLGATPVVTPPPPPPPPTGTGPSGVAVPKPGDVPGWTLLRADGFDWNCPTGSFPSGTSLGGGGTALSGIGIWTSYPSSFKDTSGNGTYHSDTVLSVHDSVLDYYMHTDSNGVPNVACAIPLLNGPGQEGGYVNLRTMSVFKVDASLEVSLPGFKMANLLWPDDEQWPVNGEIDCPECDLNGSINIFMHRQGATSGGDQDAYSTNIKVGTGWHTVIVEKTANYCKFTVDGFTATSTSRVPNTPMNWRIQNESNLNGQKPDPSIAGHIEYDLVAVWTQ